MGKLIYTGQIIIDLALLVDHIPSAGADIFGKDSSINVGAGFNVLNACVSAGGKASFAGAIGVGKFADMVRGQLEKIGVAHTGENIDLEQGYCIALTDSQAERTFISTCGAETKLSTDSFDNIVPRQSDIVFLCGYSLVHECNEKAVLRLCQRLKTQADIQADTASGTSFRSIFDPSPLVDSIHSATLETIRQLKPIWSLNEREAQILLERLSAPVQNLTANLSEVNAEDIFFAPCDSSATGVQNLKHYAFRHCDSQELSSEAIYAKSATLLSKALGTVILRAGKYGAWLAVDGGEAEHIASIEVNAVDTNGAGDAHAGTLCAMLAEGVDLAQAIRIANIAAALSTTKFGSATCPDMEQVQQYLK